jgi:hypothetical protein
MLFINSLHIHGGETSSAGKTKKMEALELCCHGGKHNINVHSINYPYIMPLT